MADLLNQPWPYLAVATLAALIGWYVLKQPRRPGTRYFVWIVGVWLVWALAAALQTVVESPELRYVFWVLQSLCALLGGPLELIFVLEYTGNEHWLARRSLLLIFLPALLFVALAFFLPGLLTSNVYQFGVPVIRGSPLLKWGLFLYVLILELITLGLLIACMLRAPAFWAPILLIALGRIIPTIGFVMFDSQWITVSPIQATILFTSVAMLAYFVALYNFGLLRVMPVARDMVISHMPYSLIVLDAENRLVDFNLAAQTLPDLPHLPGQLGKLKLQQAASGALGDWWNRISSLIGPEPVSQDVVVRKDSADLIFQVISLPLLQASGWRMGQVFVLEDVTQTRQAQRQQAQALWAQATLEEREQLAHELHDGLSQSLAFLNFQSQAAQVYLQSGQSDAAQASLVRLSEAAGEIQAETRDLISSLLSVSQPAENFCDTLRQILAGFEGQTGLAVHLEMEVHPPASTNVGETMETLCDPTRLPPPAAVQLVRITQETLANVRRHARGASQVSVALKVRDGQICLTIADDGAGFDPAAQRGDGKHFGLQIVQQRAARIGGQVSVDAAPGKGVRIEVRAPLSASGDTLFAKPVAENAARSGV
jgi:signal transduction histidine kinase